MSSAEIVIPPQQPEPNEELCIICDKPVREHSFEQQKICAEKLRVSK